MFSESVAMIIDGDGDAELYSPEGKCNYKLAQTPVGQVNPVFVYANNKIIACGAMASCWEYNIKEDSWLSFTQATFLSEHQPGVVHNGKLYVIDTNKGHVLDLASNTWSTWPMPPNKFGWGPSMVDWKDSIILLGGWWNLRKVQTFNITSQTWTVKDSSNVPIEMVLSSSLLLPQDEILIVGAARPDFFYSAAKYYPRTDTWVRLEDSKVNHLGSRLVKLGSRIFAIAGHQATTIEEFTSNTWSQVAVETKNLYKGYHSVLALPASLFAHLPDGCKGVL